MLVTLVREFWCVFCLGAYPFGHVGRWFRWYEKVCETVVMEEKENKNKWSAWGIETACGLTEQMGKWDPHSIIANVLAWRQSLDRT